MPQWRLFSSRVTAFIPPDQSIPSTLWKDVLGEEPTESFQQRLTATTIEGGSFAEGRLMLQVQPGRVDWSYEVLPAQLFRGLGAFPSALEPLMELARKWFATESFPVFARMALGAVLISDVSDRMTGYKELTDFVDGVPTAADATDFVLQINRPRPSTAVAELNINRLSKWSVSGFKAVSLQSHQETGEKYHLRLELDVNTAAEFAKKLSRAEADPILRDLLQAVVETVEKGTKF